jgi:plastocyanin
VCVLAALAVCPAGCAHTANLGHVRVLRFAVTEYRMNPQSARVTAGRLTIVVRNVGRLTHNFVISKADQVQAQTTPVPPGTRTQLTVILTPGTYQINSSLFSDQALGLYGTLIVTG